TCVRPVVRSRVTSGRSGGACSRIPASAGAPPCTRWGPGGRVDPLATSASVSLRARRGSDGGVILSLLKGQQLSEDRGLRCELRVGTGLGHAAVVEHDDAIGVAGAG